MLRRELRTPLIPSLLFSLFLLSCGTGADLSTPTATFDTLREAIAAEDIETYKACFTDDALDDNSSVKTVSMLGDGECGEDGRYHAGLHVDGASSMESAPIPAWGERIARPFVFVDRDDISMSVQHNGWSVIWCAELQHTSDTWPSFEI